MKKDKKSVKDIMKGVKKMKQEIKDMMHNKRKGKYVCIGFENCEIMRIPYEKIEMMTASNIIENKSIIYGQRIDIKSCGFFCLMINNEWANGKDKGCEYTRVEKLNRSDITSFNYDENGKEEENIYVKWKDDNHYINDFQKIYTIKGITMIIIADPKKYAKEIKEAKNI